MEFFIYLCNMFRKRHDILDAQLSVNELRPRTKEINEQNYYRRSMRFRAQATPLDNRGCRRPVHGSGWGLRFFFYKS